MVWSTETNDQTLPLGYVLTITKTCQDPESSFGRMLVCYFSATPALIMAHRNIGSKMTKEGEGDPSRIKKMPSEYVLFEKD